jgi:ribonucleoside-triphosphate reductase
MQVNIKLTKNFTTIFNKLQEKYGEEFLELQGLSDENLGLTTFIDNFVDSDNVANSSIDANSNISQKDIVSLISEMSKPHRKLLAFNKIYYELNKKYGFKEANKIIESLWNYDLYLHDFDSSTFYSYCFAYDIKEIVEKGLFFIDNYNAKPPKHLDSFVQILMEAIAFLSRRQSGAVGLPNLIPYLYYFWSRDVEKGYYTKDPETYKYQNIQALIHRLNQPWIRQDQCAFTNVSIFDHPYFEAIFGGAVFPDGKYMIDEEEEIIEFQKDFIKVINDIREENIFTFPVLTASLLYQNNRFVDEEFAKWACEASRKWNLFNFFTDSSVNSLSNCCRLKSDISDLYFNSIGGTALKVGSVKVCTLNLARLSYKNNTERDYLVDLKNKTEDCLKVLDTVRNIIKRNVEKGLLPNFYYGLIDFEHLYNTVGINGIFETMKTFNYIEQDEFGNTYYKEEAYEFGKKIFKVIRNTIDNFTLDKDYKGNVEQVPAEQAAVKLLKSDKLLYPDKVVDVLPLYGNQWIPLGIKTTIKERTKICASFDSYCNGG